MSDRLIQKLDRLYRTHRDQMYFYALGITGCTERAEDAVHDAFVKLFKLTKQPRQLRAYVFQTVRNAAIDQLRKAGNEKTVDVDCTGLYVLPENRGERAEVQQQIIRAIEGLDPQRREVVVMRLNVGLRFREIAQVLNIPCGTVASRYQRGIEDIRCKLKENGYE